MKRRFFVKRVEDYSDPRGAVSSKKTEIIIFGITVLTFYSDWVNAYYNKKLSGRVHQVLEEVKNR